MKLKEHENEVETVENIVPKSAVPVWNPSMGDYEQTNSLDDSKNLRNKILKNNLIITALITLQLVILAIAIIYFLK